MKIWVNAQLPPAIADWISKNFDVEAVAVRELGLHRATDNEIFDAARKAAVIIMTKDSDLVDMVNARGAPPQVLWLTFGNTSNARLRAILSTTMSRALASLLAGEAVVEIKDA